MRDEDSPQGHAKEPATNGQPDGPALDDEALAEAWLQHRRELRLLGERTTPQYIDFDSHRLPDDTTTQPWDFIFRQELGDLLRQLMGSLNLWRRALAELEAWAIVLERHEREARLELLVEFVWPVVESVLNTPYRVKQAMIYTAYRALDYFYQSETPLSDEEITFKELQKRAGGRPTIEAFLAALGGLDDTALRKATANYRNRHHHRFAPGIEIGILPVVSRSVEKRGTAYSFGLVRPLKLQAIIPEHEAEHRRATAAFECLWTLVREVETELGNQD